MAHKVKSLSELVTLALAPRGGNEAYCDLTTVSEVVAYKIKELHGIDTNGFVHTIGESAIRHAFNRHGDPVKERKQGQIALTAEDFFAAS